MEKQIGKQKAKGSPPVKSGKNAASDYSVTLRYDAVILSFAATPQGIEPFSYIRQPDIMLPDKDSLKYLARHGGQDRKSTPDVQDEIAAASLQSISLSAPSSLAKVKGGPHGPSLLAKEVNAEGDEQPDMASFAPAAINLGMTMGGGANDGAFMGGTSMGGGSMGGSSFAGPRPPPLQSAQPNFYPPMPPGGLPHPSTFDIFDDEENFGYTSMVGGSMGGSSFAGPPPPQSDQPGYYPPMPPGGLPLPSSFDIFDDDVDFDEYTNSSYSAPPADSVPSTFMSLPGPQRVPPPPATTYNEGGMGYGGFQNASSSPTANAIARNSLHSGSAQHGMRSTANSPFAATKVNMNHGHQEAFSLPTPLNASFGQADLTPEQGPFMSGGQGHGTAPHSQMPHPQQQYFADNKSFSAPVAQGPVRGSSRRSDDLLEDDEPDYDFRLARLLQAELDEDYDLFGDRDNIRPEDAALLYDWTSDEFDRAFEDQWAAKALKKQQSEKSHFDPTPAAQPPKEKQERTRAAARVVHNPLPANPARTAPDNGARANKTKKETIDDIRSNMQKMLDFDRIQTDEEFAAMHYGEGGVQFTRDAAKAGRNTQWTLPGDADYSYKPASPFKYSNESIFLNQRMESRRHAESMGEVAPAYAAKEIKLDQKGRVVEQVQKTKEEKEKAARDAAQADYEKAYKANLHAMAHGPKCVCNKYPSAVDPPKQNWMTRREMGGASDGKEFWEDAMDMLSGGGGEEDS